MRICIWTQTPLQIMISAQSTLTIREEAISQEERSGRGVRQLKRGLAFMKAFSRGKQAAWCLHWVLWGVMRTGQIPADPPQGEESAAPELKTKPIHMLARKSIPD